MQFQAELHLLDSFNESLRQVMDVENCLCSAKHEQEQEIMLKQKENEIRRKNLMVTQTGRDTVDTERHQGNQSKSGVQQETIKKSKYQRYTYFRIAKIRIISLRNLRITYFLFI